MIINLYDLKEIVTDVLEEFDHKHLNFDMPYFEQFVPTAENLALVLWRKFRERPETRDIESIRLCEGENLWAELYPPNDQASQDHAEPTEALLTRRYALTVKRNADCSHVETWPLPWTSRFEARLIPSRVTSRISWRWTSGSRNRSSTT